ncbi:aldo/keto reductase family protein [Desulfatitalea alkaliphila]|uniref:Aldo/keto reductase n=1 Tax=Desulfatitalea alkaliphila TaxID=2929485 RepID=A0AA41R7N7_9BACT|nr:aldo/keto reductase [Desulfatitalea alkaliphila]MCJ8503047.1 aldo/keto reductase [Desulfatitalea alkaliphila]
MTGLYPIETHLVHRERRVPTFFYGTAWKEDQTEPLVRKALAAGFRGIDTANQRRHYHEAGVGAALKSAIDAGEVRREDLFVQTKFTYTAGQDHRLPYDPAAAPAEQVAQSLASSLDHLHTEYLDAFILHGPSVRQGLSPVDWEVWRRMEALQQEGAVRRIGVSNIAVDQLTLLLEKATVMPAFVQNRCFAHTGWDARVRAVCRQNGIIYQGFSLLTANAAVLNQPGVFRLVQQLRRTVPQIVFRFALQVGMIPLTGTTSETHMREDLSVYDFELDAGDVQMIENIAVG